MNKNKSRLIFLDSNVTKNIIKLENNKITIKKDVCKTEEYFINNNYLYCGNQNLQFTRVNLDSFKTEKIIIPYPENLTSSDLYNYRFAFFN